MTINQKTRNRIEELLVSIIIGMVVYICAYNFIIYYENNCNF